MSDRERKFMHATLVSEWEMPADLRERFERQIEDLLRPGLSRAARIMCAFLAVVELLAAPAFAYGSLRVASSSEEPFIRFMLTLCMGMMSPVLLMTGAALVHMSWSGRNPDPRLRMASNVAAFALAAIFTVVVFAKLPVFEMDPSTMISVASAFMFVWTAALGAFIYQLLHRHQLNDLIEHKRLQLEIALLREQLAENS